MELNKEKFVQIGDRRTVQFEQSVDDLLLKGTAQFIVNDNALTFDSVTFSIYAQRTDNEEENPLEGEYQNLYIGEVYSSPKALNVNVYNDQYNKKDFSMVADQLEELIKTEYIK